MMTQNYFKWYSSRKGGLSVIIKIISQKRSYKWGMVRQRAAPGEVDKLIMTNKQSSKISSAN